MTGNEPFLGQAKVLSTHHGEVGIPPSDSGPLLGEKNSKAGVEADID